MSVQVPSPGLSLRGLREMSGLAVEDVARAADTPASYLSKVEKGELFPSQNYVAKIASILSASILRNSEPGARPRVLRRDPDATVELMERDA